MKFSTPRFHECYGRAYRLLAGAGCADGISALGVLAITDTRKKGDSAAGDFKKIAGGTSSKKNKNENSDTGVRCFSGLTERMGEVTLDTFLQTAKSVFIIADPYGAAHIFSCYAPTCESSGIPPYASLHP